MAWRPYHSYQPKPGKSAHALEYDARRCHVCQGTKAFFGFGPPLVAVTVYACLRHRAQVDRMFAARLRRDEFPDRPAPPPPSQGSLL